MAPSGTCARPEATTFEIVEYRALREPERLAVVEGTWRYDYRALLQAAIRFTRRLAGAGVRRGQTVAISRPGYLIELAVVLACENLGCVTVSFDAANEPDADVLFERADWVLSERPQPRAAPGRCIVLDAAFAAALRAIDVDDGTPYPREVLDLHEPQRLTRTSGSTGRSKWMLLSRQAQETWMRRVAREPQTYRPDALVLIGSPFIVNGALTQALGCLRIGAAVAFVGGHQLAGLHPTNFHGLPVSLERLLSELPPGFVFDPPVQVVTMGGFASQRLLEQAARTMRGRIVGSYSTNEANNICPALDAAGEGWLAPGVDVRILGDEGEALPAGAVGAIAVRTPGMVAGYLGNEAATAESFRDGWFICGDAGVLLAPRRLRVAGRRDDLLVIGGIKVPSRELENAVCSIFDASAASVTALPHRAGGHDLGIAIVGPQPADFAAAMARLRDGLALPARATLSVCFVEALPRTANGKIDRVALGNLFDA